MKDKKLKETDRRERRRKRSADYLKKARIKYYVRLSAALAVIIILVGAGMFLYLYKEAQGYQEQYTAELKEGMANAKDVCIEVLTEMEADSETLDNINTQYENAMLEEDVLQQYYLVDGLLDYSLTSLYAIINSKHQQVALNGGQWKDYDEEIEKLIDTQSDLKAIKEQLSNIDLTDYY